MIPFAEGTATQYEVGISIEAAPRYDKLVGLLPLGGDQRLREPKQGHRARNRSLAGSAANVPAGMVKAATLAGEAPYGEPILNATGFKTTEEVRDLNSKGRINPCPTQTLPVVVQ